MGRRNTRKREVEREAEPLSLSLSPEE
jgi:hypothetical protein